MSTNGPQQKDYTDLALLYIRRNQSAAAMQAFQVEFKKIKQNPSEVELFKRAVKVTQAQILASRQTLALEAQQNDVESKLASVEQKEAILHQRQRHLDSAFSQAVAEESSKAVDSTFGTSKKITTNNF